MKKRRWLPFLLALLLMTTALTATAAESRQETEAIIHDYTLTVFPEIYQSTPEILTSDTLTLLVHFLHTDLMRIEATASSFASFKRPYIRELSLHPEFRELLFRSNLLEALETYAGKIASGAPEIKYAFDISTFYIFISHDSVAALINSTEISDSYPTLSAVYSYIKAYNASFLPDGSARKPAAFRRIHPAAVPVQPFF